MFNSEREVPSLELCKKLKELGYPQDGEGWYWVEVKSGYKWEWKLRLLVNFPYAVDNYKIKAPTVRELGEWLPEGFNEFKLNNKFWIKNKKDCCYVVSNDTEANARAEMLIWLIENGYVKFKQEV